MARTTTNFIKTLQKNTNIAKRSRISAKDLTKIQILSKNEQNTVNRS